MLCVSSVCLSLVWQVINHLAWGIVWHTICVICPTAQYETTPHRFIRLKNQLPNNTTINVLFNHVHIQSAYQNLTIIFHCGLIRNKLKTTTNSNWNSLINQFILDEIQSIQIWSVRVRECQLFKRISLKLVKFRIPSVICTYCKNHPSHEI